MRKSDAATILNEMDKAYPLLEQLEICFKNADFVGGDIGYAENQFQELYQEIARIKEEYRDVLSEDDDRWMVAS